MGGIPDGSAVLFCSPHCREGWTHKVWGDREGRDREWEEEGREKGGGGWRQGREGWTHKVWRDREGRDREWEEKGREKGGGGWRQCCLELG